MTNVPMFPQGDPPLDGWTLEALLSGDGAAASQGATGGGRSAAQLAALLAAARGPATTAELRGEAAAVAAFTQAATVGISRPARSLARRSAMLSTFLGSKIALAAAAGGLSVAGLSAAAFANALPDAAQDFAHHAIGAPAADQDSKGQQPASNPVGPDATGNAAYGLCTAYAAQHEHGKTNTHSIAFRNLAAAAGGAKNITAYCATIPKPGSTPSEHPTGDPRDQLTGAHSPHPTGQSETHPTPDATHPVGPPSPRPTGQSDTHPNPDATHPAGH